MTFEKIVLMDVVQHEMLDMQEQYESTFETLHNPLVGRNIFFADSANPGLDERRWG